MADDETVLCEYLIEGNSDKGSTKYDFVSCNAALCDEEVTEDGRFTKVCKEPEDWKDNERFDVAIFDTSIFEPWCVSLPENGSSIHSGGLNFVLSIWIIGLAWAVN